MAKKSEVKKNYAATWGISEASQRVSELIKCMESGAPLDDAFDEILRLDQLNLVSTVDSAIDCLQYLDGLQKSCMRARKMWSDRAKRIKLIRERAKQRIRETIEAHPLVIYEGHNGSLNLRRNPGKLVLDIETKDKVVRSVIKNPDDLDKIPPEFIDHVTMLVINAQRIKEAIAGGAEFPWARIVKGTSLTIGDPNANLPID